MKDDAFRWSMYYKGVELKENNHFSCSKQEVWKEIVNNYNYDKGKNYTLMNRPMLEQLGYSVQESSWYRGRYGT